MGMREGDGKVGDLRWLDLTKPSTKYDSMPRVGISVVIWAMRQRLKKIPARPIVAASLGIASW